MSTGTPEKKPGPGQSILSLVSLSAMFMDHMPDVPKETHGPGICSCCKMRREVLKKATRPSGKTETYCRKCAPTRETDADWPPVTETPTLTPANYIKMIADTAIAAAHKALKEFGTYTFDDKGPHEVMDLVQFTETISNVPTAEAAEVIRTIAADTSLGGRRSIRLASALLRELEDWDDLFYEEGMEELY